MDARPTPARRDQLYAAALLLVIAVAAWWARSVLIPVVLAVLLAFVLAPAVMALQRRGVKRLPAVLLVALVALVAGLGVASVVGSQLLQLARDLPEKKDVLVSKLKEVRGSEPSLLERWGELLSELGKAGDPDSPKNPDVVRVRVEDDKLSAGKVLPWVAEPVAHLGGSVSVIVILTLSILLLREDLRDRLIRLIGYGHLTSTTRAFEEASRRIGKYLTVQLAVNAAVGLVFGAGLAVAGVDYAWLWGLLTIALRFIPYIGHWLAMLFPLVSSLTEEGWVQPVAVVVLAVLLWAAADQVVAPRLVVRYTGVSIISLVVASTFWTWLWGPIGLLLSTPMTVCLVVLGRHVPQLEFLDVLFGTSPPLDPRLTLYQRLLARDVGEAAERLDDYLDKHTPLELCDEVLVPTLVRAREDQEAGRLDEHDLRELVRTVGDLFDNLSLTEGDEPAPEEAPADAPVVLTCAANDEREEVVLRLFARLLPRSAARVETLRGHAMASEVVQKVEEVRPAAVVVASLPPAGLAQARHVCKRLRTRFPGLQVMVLALGLEEGAEGAAAQLTAAGASQVPTRVREALPTLASYLHTTAATDPSVDGRPEGGKARAERGRG